jgi:hypothetical protein
MRQEKKQTVHGTDQFIFMSASEIPAMMQKHERFMKGGNWYGDTLESFKRKAVVGDNGLVEESEKFLAMIEGQLPMSRGYRNIDDVVGAVPNVPAFLAGHPQHMRRRTRVARDNAPLTIYMDLTSSAMIDAATVGKRGVVLLALVRMLVEHRAVELWVGTSKGVRRYSGTVAWRIDTTPLDLARAAYHIGSTAMARGFGYGIDNACHTTGGHWPFADYALHCRTAEERLREAMGFGEFLFIPPIHGHDPMTTNPVAWIKKQLEKYVGSEEQ